MQKKVVYFFLLRTEEYFLIQLYVMINYFYSVQLKIRACCFRFLPVKLVDIDGRYTKSYVD